MKAIAICGSPRRNGNTEFLLNRCLTSLKNQGIETELIPLSELSIKPCRGCNVCRTLGNMSCSIKDDDFNATFSKMVEADIIVVGSPVYFGSATPETMALLDRAGYVSRGNGGLFSRKIGGPVTVARRAGQNFTYAQLIYWFTINDMIVPGSTYWNVATAMNKGEVENDKEALATIDRFAENLAWLGKRLKD